MNSATVVGAGVFGAATARELALRGWDVTLVEQYTPGNVRSGSGGDTRLSRAAHGSVEWYTRMSRRARTIWLELRRRRDAHLGTGRRRVVRPARGRLRAASRATLERAGVPYEWLTPTTRATSTPRSTTDDLHAVLFEPEGGVLHARRATQLLVQDGERRGVRLRARPQLAGGRPSLRRRRLGVRLVAAAVLPRAGRAEDLAPGRLLLRHRRLVERYARLLRVRRAVLRPR